EKLETRNSPPSFQAQKSEGAHFDAFLGRRIRRAHGIIESRMRGPPRSAVFPAIVGLEHQRLVSLHVGKINPTVVRVEGNVVDLADSVRVASFSRNQILIRKAPRVGNGER